VDIPYPLSVGALKCGFYKRVGAYIVTAPFTAYIVLYLITDFLYIYSTIYGCMKIRIKRDILVEINKSRLNEVWDKTLYRGNELHIDNAIVEGKWANLTDYDGDVILNIPVDAYEKL